MVFFNQFFFIRMNFLGLFEKIKSLNYVVIMVFTLIISIHLI
jgi:hypothetical protein